MGHGYYDPRTPGAPELNEREFGKVFTGVLAGHYAAWCGYLGVEHVRRILIKLREHPDLWCHAPLTRFAPPTLSKPWTFSELDRACTESLGAVCFVWCGYLGEEAVVEVLRYAEQDHDWDQTEAITDRAVAYFLETDRTEGVN